MGISIEIPKQGIIAIWKHIGSWTFLRHFKLVLHCLEEKKKAIEQYKVAQPTTIINST